MYLPYTRLISSEGIARIEFFHPKANAFSSEQLQSLKRAIEQASEQSDIQVILLQSVGSDVFSAGAFLDELACISSLEEGIEFFMNFSRLFCSIIKSQKPIVAAFSGKAVGGAVGLLAACDYVIGDPSALVRLSELSVGLAPLVIEPLLVHRIGKANYIKLALNPKQWQDALWCEKSGLISYLTDQKENLSDALTKYVNCLAAYDSFSIAKIKSVFYGNLSTWRKLLENRARSSAELILRPGVQKNILRKRNSR